MSAITGALSHFSCRNSNKWAVQDQHLLRTTSNCRTNYNPAGLEAKFGGLVMDVKNALSRNKPLDNLVMIDALQRMGMEYQFEEEIKRILEREYTQLDCFLNYKTPFEVSLSFRLLRQGGYYVPAYIFEQFKNKDDGKFGMRLRHDISGLMGLYEASQLSVEGEDILDQVLNFSRDNLSACLKEHNDSWVQAKIISDTLKHPYHKSLASFKSKSFITHFNGINGLGRSTLQELSDIDCSITQELHQHELFQVSGWWRSLGLAEELTLLRDQPLKWYTWSMALLTDPRLSEQRIELAKCVSFIYVLDDIFDVYGTVEDLTLFTQAVNRWELSAMENLPEYMRLPYRVLYDTTNSTGYEIYKKYGCNPIEDLRKTWGSLCNAFLKEAKWFASGVLPEADEYLKNGVVSSGVHVVSVQMFYLLGLHGTIQLEDTSAMASSGAMILRLSDDLGSAKDENQEGKDGSYIEYYMKGQKNPSLELARDHVFKLIENEWKQLNKEHLRLGLSSGSFTKSLLNLARMVPLMYSYDDNQSLPVLQEYIKSMLVV